MNPTTVRSASLISACLKIVACLSIFVATAWALLELSQFQLTRYLRDRAAKELALAAVGDSPYRWRFHSPDDIVAGTVFNAAQFEFGDRQLQIRSNGKPFQIGLPLTTPLSVTRFPRLELLLYTQSDVKVQVLIRRQLNAALYTSEPIRVGSGRQSLDVNLASRQWRIENSKAPAPSIAAMLRLAIDAPVGKLVVLKHVALEPAEAAHVPNLNLPVRLVSAGSSAPAQTLAIYRLPENDVDAALHQIATANGPKRLPLVALPRHSRVEQRLVLRDHVRTVLPGAIIVPGSSIVPTLQRARAATPGVHRHAPSGWRWLLLVLWLTAMLWLRVRPPVHARLRALFEVILVLGGPMWLIVGGEFSGHINLFLGVLIAATLAFAFSLPAPHAWRWNGSGRAWAGAGLVALLAAGIGIGFHPHDNGLRHLGSAHVVRYVLWALLQQYLICTVCLERWRIVFDGRALIAVYVGALGFAVLHTPNAMLMLATLLGGVCWCALYLRERALLPLAASHAASALVLLALLPRDWLYSAEVSARFFH